MEEKEGRRRDEMGERGKRREARHTQRERKQRYRKERESTGTHTHRGRREEEEKRKEEQRRHTFVSLSKARAADSTNMRSGREYRSLGTMAGGCSKRNEGKQ
jgi:hypothetical protein